VAKPPVAVSFVGDSEAAVVGLEWVIVVKIVFQAWRSGPLPVPTARDVLDSLYSSIRDIRCFSPPEQRKWLETVELDIECNE